MTFTRIVLASMATLALGSAPVQAQEELELTITLLPEHVELPDAVTRDLELPRDDAGEFRPSEQGVENSAAGLETANLAREDGRAFGQDTAADAQENRENLGRESRPDLEELLPDQVPNVPDVPDAPATPPVPPGPPDGTPGGPPGP